MENIIKNVEAESKELTAEWQAEQQKMRGLSDAMAALDAAKAEVATAMRNGDYEKASALQYGKIPELEEKIAKMNADAKEYKTVLPEHIAAVVSKWTGVPADRLNAEEQSKLLNIEDALRARVVGQDHAVGVIARAIRRSRAGLSDPRRPMGSFMFLGPTGVGKTEVAKALAEYLFNDDTAMTRIDMSEYMEPHSVSRLIGSPPGYVGYEQGGVLTESVRRRPYQVLLFDEIEKANPDVFNVFLQILDDGRLTDGQGHVVNFTNTIIIMTSNLPDMAAVKKHFRPEFINRIDEIVFFNPLGKDVMSGIVRIQLTGLEKRLAERRISMNVTDKAIKWLGDNGYDAVFGARPLKRLITSAVEDKIADLILSGALNEGSTVYIDVHGKSLTVN